MALVNKHEMRDEDAEEEARGLIATVKEAILKPFDIAFSRSAQRAYLTTFLVVSTSIVLLGFAITAYILFYWSYIPRIGFERTIHLQFDDVLPRSDSRYNSAGNPYGTVTLTPDIVSEQRYDVLVQLTMPRTRDNRETGNFMLELSMYAPGSVVDPVKDKLVPGSADEDNRLATSRRPSILHYRSHLVEGLYTLTQLHWYILGWRHEAETMKVSMFEAVEFSRGWRNVPATMKLEIQSRNLIQVYSAKAMFRARFRGLRWLMYNHRIISAAIFISAFWTTEMLCTGLAWAAISFYLQPPSQDAKADQLHDVAENIKQENADEKPLLSDTERTFPSSSRQQPLRYESPRIKQEEEDGVVVPDEAVIKATEEADDEDEDVDDFRDSGLGTGLESSASRRDSTRRRKGRTLSEDGMK